MPENSDQANILLIASDMLHGNLLLHGWYLTDVSFYTTELPQYALLEIFFGVHANTAHIAAAMTYTLAVLLAVLVARGGFTSRAAVVRMLIAAGIMLAPQLGIGVSALILSVGHIGTSVPVLLIWLLLDRAPQRWYVPLLTALGLAWVLIADQLVLIVGVRTAGPGLRPPGGRGGGPGTQPVPRRRRAPVRAVPDRGGGRRGGARLGGRAGAPGPRRLRPEPDPVQIHASAIPGRVCTPCGPCRRSSAPITAGWPAGPYDTALLHMGEPGPGRLALLVAARRFFSGAALVDQILAVAIAGNIVLFVLTSAGSEGPHEIAVVAPFGAALAARMLATPQASRARTRRAPARRARAVAYGAGLVVLLGYLGGLAHEVIQPAAPPDNSQVASWLEAHHLRYGLGGYWESSIVTVETGGQVKVRALLKSTMGRDLWQAKPSWYDPASQRANFIVLSSAPGYLNWEPRALIRKYFGRPAREYNVGPYTVMVWNRNLLPSIPR